MYVCIYIYIYTYLSISSGQGYGYEYRSSVEGGCLAARRRGCYTRSP